MREFDVRLARLGEQAALRLLARFSMSAQTAATLLMKVRNNRSRLRNEASLAVLCSLSPQGWALWKWYLSISTAAK